MTEPSFRWQLERNAGAVADRAADLLAAALIEAVDERGVALIALSGGSTPRAALEQLATRPGVPWSNVHLAQVDERLAPDGGTDRNLTMIQAALLDHIEPASVLAMPVGAAETNPDAASAAYIETLANVVGSPVQIDVLQLGLGGDGHTASLVPEDPVLAIDDRDVAVTAIYNDRRRMTLTGPCLRRARQTIWIAHGEGKRDALTALASGSPAIPAHLAIGADNIVVTDVEIERPAS